MPWAANAAHRVQAPATVSLNHVTPNVILSHSIVLRIHAQIVEHRQSRTLSLHTFLRRLVVGNHCKHPHITHYCCNKTQSGKVSGRFISIREYFLLPSQESSTAPDPWTPWPAHFCRLWAAFCARAKLPRRSDGGCFCPAKSARCNKSRLDAFPRRL